MKRSARLFSSVRGRAALLSGVLCVVWGAIWLHLSMDYRRTVREAEARTASLALSLEENAQRSATVLDNALLNARTLYLRDPSHFDIGPWMRDESVLMTIADRMSIANAAGIVVTSSTGNGPPPEDISARKDFLVHAGTREDNLFIGEPSIGRGARRSSVLFTRRVSNPDGSFAGVAAVSFDPLVIGGYPNRPRGDGGFTMLIGDDGVVLAAQPDAELVGTILREPGILGKADESPPRPVVGGTTTAMGDLAIVSYRKVSGFPLVVAAGFPVEAVFALYESERRAAIPAGLAVSLFVLAVGAAAIRDRQRLARYHRAFALTLDNIGQGILTIDPDRRVSVVNRRVAELLELPEEFGGPGADNAAMIERSLAHGSQADGSLAHAASHREPAGGKRSGATIRESGVGPNPPFHDRHCYETTRANGSVLEVTTTALPDGSVVRTFADIGEHKRTERELAAARDEAEAGSRARTEFLAIMSHEIRTPMNGIVGASGLLQDMPLGLEQREYVRVIRESSDRLLSMVQDIMDFSRLDAGRMDLEEIAFDPVATIQGAIAMVRGEANAKGLYLRSRIAGNVPRGVFGDPSRLRQILVNLAGNGIKFTETGGVAVEAKAVSSDETVVTLAIAVVDTGIGIDAEDASKLFSAFKQVDSSTSRRFGGAGLGLVICKHLVGLMGGTIEVDTRAGQGSTFRIAVPLRLALGDSAPPVSQDDRDSGRSLKILLAEDNPTNRFVATRMLTRMGHTVDPVEDGAQAARAAASADYDVILMDMMMPEVDGLMATRTIRAGAAPRRDTVIVGLTANALASDRAACEAAGMDDFITKPVTMERLRAVLEEIALPSRPVPLRRDARDGILLDREFLRQFDEEIGSGGAAEIMEAFLEEGPRRLAAIEVAMAAGDVQAVRREAHALAGTALDIGLTGLGEAAYDLQVAAEGAGPDAGSVVVLATLLHDTLPLAAAWARDHTWTGTPAR